jgi:hypothetical protein
MSSNFDLSEKRLKNEDEDVHAFLADAFASDERAALAFQESLRMLAGGWASSGRHAMKKLGALVSRAVVATRSGDEESRRVFELAALKIRAFDPYMRKETLMGIVFAESLPALKIFAQRVSIDWKQATLELVEGKKWPLAPFCVACGAGLPMLRALVGLGADPEAVSPNGADVKGLAAWGGEVETLVWALDRLGEKERKAALDAGGDRVGGGLLARAALKGQIGALRWLIEAGAAIDAADPKGNAALAWAAENDHADAVRALAAAGADLDRQNAEGATALMSAASGKGSEAAKALLAAGASTAPQAQNGYTALMVAVDSRNVGAVRALIASGANPDAQNEDGDTALSMAIKRDNEELANLLATCSNPLLRNHENANAIELAMSKKRWGCVDAMSQKIDDETAAELLMAVVARKLPKLASKAESFFLRAALSETGAASAAAGSASEGDCEPIFDGAAAAASGSLKIGRGKSRL